jgi:hypothetical protein
MRAASEDACEHVGHDAQANALVAADGQDDAAEGGLSVRGRTPGAPQGGLRLRVRCLLDGRLFESFHLDVGTGDPLPGEVDYLMGLPLLEFAGIAPARVLAPGHLRVNVTT